MAFPAHPGGEGNETDPLSAARGRPHVTAAAAEDRGQLDTGHMIARVT